METMQRPPKPESHLVLAIITTVFCCLPLGIVSIVKATQVDSLYNSGQYDLAVAASNEASKWAKYGIISAVICWVLYVILCFGLGIGVAALGQ